MNISDIIQKILDDYDITQAELAKILNVSSSSISRSLNGLNNMRTETLCLLSYHFDIPLEKVMNYKSIVAPHEKLKAEILKKNNVYDLNKKEELQSILSFAEEQEHQNVSYSMLLREASFEAAKITLDSGEKFKARDLIFYRKEKLSREGHVLYSPSPKDFEIRYLVQAGREVNLLHPNDLSDVVRYSLSSHKPGRVLGYVYYLVRSFKNQTGGKNSLKKNR